MMFRSCALFACLVASAVAFQITVYEGQPQPTTCSGGTPISFTASSVCSVVSINGQQVACAYGTQSGNMVTIYYTTQLAGGCTSTQCTNNPSGQAVVIQMALGGCNTTYQIGAPPIMATAGAASVAPSALLVAAAAVLLSFAKAL